MNYKEIAICMLENNDDERLDGLVYHFMKEILGDKGMICELQERISNMVREINNVKSLGSIYYFVGAKYDKELERKAKNELQS